MRGFKPTVNWIRHSASCACTPVTGYVAATFCPFRQAVLQSGGLQFQLTNQKIAEFRVSRSDVRTEVKVALNIQHPLTFKAYVCQYIRVDTDNTNVLCCKNRI